MAKIEREVKLAAWGGFTLPALDDLAPDLTVEPLKTKKLDATYYDTRDLRLARAGVSLRHRLGDDPPWTVKLPDGDSGPVMSRREIPFDGPAGAIPEAAAALVRAYVRSEPLVPVARLKTERSRVGLKIAGTPVAEIADDEVSVYHGRRLASRFREVEVEVEEEAPDKLLPAVVERLRDAGAGAPDKTPKVVRALGPRALEPLPGLVTAVGPDSTMGEVVRAAVGNALAASWPTIPASASATTLRTCTRPASGPAGSGPTCGRSVPCSTSTGWPGCGRRPAGTPGCSVRCATPKC